MVEQELTELFGAHEARLDIFDRDRRRRAPLGAEGGHVADQLARSADGQHHLALIGTVGDEAHATREDHRHVIPGRTRVQQRPRPRDGPPAHALDHGIGILMPELAQKRDVPGAHATDFRNRGRDVRNVATGRPSAAIP
jgi:hypothetical protein